MYSMYSIQGCGAVPCVLRGSQVKTMWVRYRSCAFVMCDFGLGVCFEAIVVFSVCLITDDKLYLGSVIHCKLIITMAADYSRNLVFIG